MQVFSLKSETNLKELIQKERALRQLSNREVKQTVSDIFESVMTPEGSCSAAGIAAQTAKFDSSFVNESNLAIKPQAKSVTSEAKNLIDAAIRRVERFHRHQFEALFQGMDRLPKGGLRWTCEAIPHSNGREGQIFLPIERVGIYIPGGRASYPSSVIMNVIPALEAGVSEIVVATPPGADGEVNDEVEFACQRLGVKTILKAGGAAAVFALAHGIEGLLEPVDLIAGPGNKYVNEAKRMVWGTVGLDGLAGPSEVAVVIDDSSNMEWAASDAAAQIEHAPDNVVRIYAQTESAWKSFEAAMTEQMAQEERGAVICKAWDDLGMAVICSSESLLLQAIDAFAPEHLAIHLRSPEDFAVKIKNAGSISVGRFSAQSFGDYAAGPSHTLPTSGAARYASPVSVLTFTKISSYSSFDKASADELIPIAEGFGRLEGFPAHARCARLRGE